MTLTQSTNLAGPSPMGSEASADKRTDPKILERLPQDPFVVRVSSHSDAFKGKRYPPEVLAPDEVRLLLEACASDPGTELRNWALLTVPYRAGLRCSEAISLEPKVINLTAMSIRVLHGKGSRARTVGVDPGALSETGRWTEERSRGGFCSGVDDLGRRGRRRPRSPTATSGFDSSLSAASMAAATTPVVFLARWESS